MSKGKEVEVRFTLPAEYADSILSIGRIDDWNRFETVADLCRHLAMTYFKDSRRRHIPVRRLSLGLKIDLFNALVRKVGSGGMASYMRESIWGDLLQRKLTKGLTEPPDWKSGRAENAKKRKQRTDYATIDDRADTKMYALLIPEDWFDTLNGLYPGNVSTYIKACVQTRLQLETGKLYTCQHTMRSFLSEYKE